MQILARVTPEFIGHMPPAANQAKRKVFVVDDHPLVREWLAGLINQQPDLVVVGQAGDGAHALAGVDELKPDVVILDISLKDCSGVELVKTLKQAWPKLLVLVLSIHEESIYGHRALQAGARGYIMKSESTK